MTEVRGFSRWLFHLHLRILWRKSHYHSPLSLSIKMSYSSLNCIYLFTFCWMMKLNHVPSTIPSMLNVLFPFLPMFVEIEIDSETGSTENQLNLQNKHELNYTEIYSRNPLPNEAAVPFPWWELNNLPQRSWIVEGIQFDFELDFIGWSPFRKCPYEFIRFNLSSLILDKDLRNQRNIIR